MFVPVLMMRYVCLFSKFQLYKSEYGITVMVGGEELDLVDNGTETCGVMQAQKLTVTVPAGSDDKTMTDAACADKKIAGYLEGMDIVKVICVRDKLVNLILKPKK